MKTPVWKKCHTQCLNTNAKLKKNVENILQKARFLSMQRALTNKFLKIQTIKTRVCRERG